MKASDNFSQSEELTEHVSAPGSEAARHLKGGTSYQSSVHFKLKSKMRLLTIRRNATSRM